MAHTHIRGTGLEAEAGVSGPVTQEVGVLCADEGSNLETQWEQMYNFKYSEHQYLNSVKCVNGGLVGRLSG